ITSISVNPLAFDLFDILSARRQGRLHCDLRASICCNPAAPGSPSMSGSGGLTGGRTRGRGTFEVGKPGVQAARGRPIRWPGRWPRSQWKPLLVALALSLAVHVL